MKMNTNTMLLVLVGLLVVIAGVQAVQLNTMYQALSTGAISGVKSSALSTLPSQVGGC